VLLVLSGIMRFGITLSTYHIIMYFRCKWLTRVHVCKLLLNNIHKPSYNRY